MRETEEYLPLVPPLHRNKPKFQETLKTLIAPYVEMCRATLKLPADFDLDAATGVQLDVVGEWVGRSRFIPVGIPDAWFSFDDARLGFDLGYWKGVYDNGTTLTRLDDETYRRLLRAKIVANYADGTLAGFQSALDIYFAPYTTTDVYLIDNGRGVPLVGLFTFDRPGLGFDQGYWESIDTVPAQSDMSVTLVLAGDLPPIVDLYILQMELLPLRPAGVELNFAIETVNKGAVFGFDLNTSSIKGFDLGSWGATPEYVALNVPY